MSETSRRHEHYMQEALRLAVNAAVMGEVPVGCVIVCDDKIVSVGANEIERTGNPTRHAELVAIENAVQVLGDKHLRDCTLYVTLEPCAMCAGAILLARIPTVVYGATDEKTGACNSLYELLDDPRLNHKATVRSGILSQECAALLTNFFEERRVGSLEVEKTDESVKTNKAGGVLYLVPTPIGNLDDMTLRAVKVLREVDVIVCEDSRRTSPLLKRFDVPKKRLIVSHDHNERDRSNEIAELVQSGSTVALVSDAGMPGISDPGYRAVTACLERGLIVTALPGASAMITATVASGLPTDSIYFGGFAPQKKGRRAFLERVLKMHSTIVLYESPYRLVDLISEIVEIAGNDRPVVVARELTKIHEEYIRGNAANVLSTLVQRSSIKGEVVVLIGGMTENGEG